MFSKKFTTKMVCIKNIKQMINFKQHFQEYIKFYDLKNWYEYKEWGTNIKHP
jgi:hypothetical protein